MTQANLLNKQNLSGLDMCAEQRGEHALTLEGKLNVRRKQPQPDLVHKTSSRHVRRCDA